jgi:hypothetical protein
MCRVGRRRGPATMPTFPSSSLKSRTVSFPQSGLKAGLSDGAFPLKMSSGLPPSFMHTALRILPSLSVEGDAGHVCITVQATPRRFTPGVLAPGGLCCPALPRLFDPMRPTRQHISTSPHRLIRNAFAGRLNTTPRRLASGSVLSLYAPSRHAALLDLGESIGCTRSVLPR